MGESQKPLIERAMELARAGGYANITQVRKALKAEGYEGIEFHFDGADFKRRLKAALIGRDLKPLRLRRGTTSFRSRALQD